LAVTFFIANKLDEITSNDKFVQFDDDIHYIVWNDKEKLPNEARLLYNLDPYGIRCLTSSEVEQLKTVCTELQLIYRDITMNDFFKSLFNLCNSALQQRRNIMAVGD